MKPLLYSAPATVIVLPTPQPSEEPAACNIVSVVNAGLGLVTLLPSFASSIIIFLSDSKAAITSSTICLSLVRDESNFPSESLQQFSSSLSWNLTMNFNSLAKACDEKKELGQMLLFPIHDLQ